MSKGKNKKKKDKVRYIDDGRTIADMSGVGGARYTRRDGTPRASFKEQWRTYTAAVRMMFLPMLVVLGIICLAFLITYLLIL